MSSSLCHFSCFSIVLLTLSLSTTHAAQKNTILHTQLDNGLEVILKPDHRSPMVMSHIWYKVGSTDESGNTLGVSHALEHMMFKGTEKVPNDEFTRLSRMYGGSINAATFTNYTNYYQLYPKAYFPMALELEADRMTNLVLRQQDFDTEIKVVMEERRQRTEGNSHALAFERFKWISLPTSHYRQPIIGHMKTLENLRLEDLKTWYQTWYTPNNAILVVVGDIEPQHALAQIQQYFGSIPARDLPQRNDVREFDRLGYRYMEIFTDVQVPNLYMTWNVKSLTTATQKNDAYALSMLRSILDSGISSRLQHKLVREQKILTSVSVNYDMYSRGDSLFGISALPAHGVSLSAAEHAIQTELSLIQTELTQPKELERIRNRLIANLTYSQDDISTQAKNIGNLAVNGLDFRLAEQLPEKFAAIRPTDIQRVAQRYFIRENLSVLHLLPENLSK